MRSKILRAFGVLISGPEREFDLEGPNGERVQYRVDWIFRNARISVGIVGRQLLIVERSAQCIVAAIFKTGEELFNYWVPRHPQSRSRDYELGLRILFEWAYIVGAKLQWAAAKQTGYVDLYHGPSGVIMEMKFSGRSRRRKRAIPAG